MTKTRTAILGVGQYVPSRVVTNDELAEMFDTSDEWIRQRTGIEERRFIEHAGIAPSDLAVPAVQEACQKANIEVRDIDAIIFATLSPDHDFPGSGCFLGHKLELPGVPALDIRNQCSGYLYGLQIADAWIRCGMYERVCLVGAEVHSTALDFSDAGRDIAVLFGDGAAATILGPTSMLKKGAEPLGTLLKHCELETSERVSPLFQQAATEEDRGVIDVEVHADGVGAKELWMEAPASGSIPRITKEMIDNRAVFPSMNGKQVFRWATSKMPECALSVMARNGVSLDDIDLVVPHQANVRINEFISEKLGLPPEKIVHNIAKYGNTTAASIPMALYAAIQQGRANEGDLVLFMGFGAGFTWGAALVRL
ncbi:3-oxoacyl-[acyl-carrier-protein] synthase 3 [Rubripirellula tenax]|uniref:Beta-ketoacyl-[acyl-carrier-protein] synthase III n=1 Tax=Rubripirellula tenax TaxID=2528015 RepID=A0A5C6FLU9_9BACT|nr:beta-ketoacyl-ACP synthase III [Rubripirellula tenax]TWU60804.1 3-oxoacyl-[acyl-carrier-protein] synthase 3 [Rubripirellula tenax]